MRCFYMVNISKFRISYYSSIINGNISYAQENNFKTKNAWYT